MIRSLFYENISNFGFWDSKLRSVNLLGDNFFSKYYSISNFARSNVSGLSINSGYKLFFWSCFHIKTVEDFEWDLSHFGSYFSFYNLFFFSHYLKFLNSIDMRKRNYWLFSFNQCKLFSSFFIDYLIWKMSSFFPNCCLSLLLKIIYLLKILFIRRKQKKNIRLNIYKRLGYSFFLNIFLNVKSLQRLILRKLRLLQIFAKYD